MKIVKVDDCEFWIGESLEACVAAVADLIGEPPNGDYFKDAHELDDEALDRLKRAETDENEQRTGVEPTFREAMASEIAEGGDFPRLFAATEF